ncbi:transcription factor CP2 [Trichonephila clavipes]|nr:transcription factor CP2 [Trichonephila clavipes]
MSELMILNSLHTIDTVKGHASLLPLACGFVCVPFTLPSPHPDSVKAFHAIYLQALTYGELQKEVSKTYNLSEDSIGNIYITGPNGILLVLTERVLQNLKDESTYICEIMKAEENEKYTIILRSYIPNQEM